MRNYNQLPQDCISHLLSLTTPRGACVLSAVSPTFRSMADSDATWQQFLPSDYASFLSHAVVPVEHASKKELFLRLCDHPVPIYGGKMVILYLISVVILKGRQRVGGYGESNILLYNFVHFYKNCTLGPC